MRTTDKSEPWAMVRPALGWAMALFRLDGPGAVVMCHVPRCAPSVSASACCMGYALTMAGGSTSTVAPTLALHPGEETRSLASMRHVARGGAGGRKMDAEHASRMCFVP